MYDITFDVLKCASKPTQGAAALLPHGAVGARCGCAGEVCA